MTRPETVISFVVDAKPVFQTQAWLLLHNLSCLALPDRTAILLNHCGPLAPELRAKAEDCGATIQPIARFGDGPAAYCNKLQQFDGVLASGADHAVLCDTDIVFLSPPVAWGSAQAVRAKTVDISNPSEPIFRRMLDLAGMGDVPLDHQPQFGRHLRRGRTHPLNCNGGLYLLPTDLLRQLAPAWRKWADFCLGHATELGKAAVHSDQVGFALAMLELGLPFEALDTARNFPLHFAAEDYAGSADTAPTGLHYHKTLQADGRLVTLAPPGPIQTAVARFNEMAQSARRDTGFHALLGRSHAAGDRMKRRLFLHVGLPKTGTTSMQKWFLDNRDALMAQGLCYPTDPPLHNYKQGYTVAALCRGDLAPIRAALTQNRTLDVLLSNEGMSNHFHDFPAAALKAFRDLTADRDVRVIGFYRDPDRWLRSYHRQAVLNPRNSASELWGTAQDASEIRSHYRVRRLLDHDRLATEMAEGFGARAMDMLDFDRTDAFARMLGLLGLDALADIPLPRINEAVPDWAIAMMQRINAREPGNPERQAWKAVLYHFLSSNHTVLRDDARGLGPDMMDQINPRHLEDMPPGVPTVAIRDFLKDRMPAILRT